MNIEQGISNVEVFKAPLGVWGMDLWNSKNHSLSFIVYSL
jgi:hypothetical protein